MRVNLFIQMMAWARLRDLSLPSCTASKTAGIMGRWLCLGCLGSPSAAWMDLKIESHHC